jgi:hypothetical protein
MQAYDGLVADRPWGLLAKQDPLPLLGGYAELLLLLKEWKMARELAEVGLQAYGLVFCSSLVPDRGEPACCQQIH